MEIFSIFPGEIFIKFQVHSLIKKETLSEILEGNTMIVKSKKPLIKGFIIISSSTKKRKNLPSRL